ncbi:oxygen-independent coproporphyrinogen III oxidase [Aliikangiella maris]|uniref:Coproporphyrinogen-III oxidase n=2 Tax=Aliikangiella maris TaxID=3162458 RepID=A0ABV3MIR4_9GAMM
MQSLKLEWDENLLNKYDVSGPRYTSYPTALEFSDEYMQSDYITCLENIAQDKSLSLYIHIPFCQNICYYCACNKVITKDKSKTIQYVENLVREIQLVSSHLKAKTLKQIHWGGGTPTYLSMKQIALIMDTIRTCFDVPDDVSTEVSIEVDPRALAITDIKVLAQMGFNRMSMGVQDFDPKVQQSINRIQSFEITRDLINEARKHGFRSINLDLIYGLPLQTRETFAATLDKVIQISPDRISVFNYAHLPHRFKPQRRIKSAELPTPVEKLAIFAYIIDKLQQSGYCYIGMDHFAKPDDELAIAQNNQQLHRNFQGYTTHEEYELIGVGVSAIGSLNGQYHQNVREVDSYYHLLEQGQLPTWRGASMTFDDTIRKNVIFDLICHFYLDINQIETRYHINFKTYFSRELKMLQPLIEDKLITYSGDSIQVFAKGRLLIRNICMTFDAYLNELQEIRCFSKVI